MSKNVVLGVTGGIACYKACQLVSSLKKKGYSVDVIMTKNACEFVSPLTFETLSGRPVVVSTFDRNHPWEVEHISLAKKADIFVIAPATANIIGKIACGIADDMLSTTVMATKSPVLVAPAMNTNMYENPVVRENIARLKSLGYLFIEPSVGRLACGDVGKGKMAEPSEIEAEIEKILFPQNDFRGKKVLVTAGGTAQPIDGVRCITNYSSGKMGCAVAAAAAKRGAEVTLVLGLHSCETPSGVKTIKAETTAEMFEAVKKEYSEADAVIMAAAPSDYRPSEKIFNKIKGDEVTLKLVKNDDIAEFVGKNKHGDAVLVIFAAETENLIKNAEAKLAKKHAELVVANDVTKDGAGFGTDTNIATIIGGGIKRECEKMSKEELADVILDEIKKVRG